MKNPIKPREDLDVISSGQCLKKNGLNSKINKVYFIMMKLFYGKLGEQFWQQCYTEKERADFVYFSSLKIGDLYEGCDCLNHKIIAKKPSFRSVGKACIAVNKVGYWNSLSDKEKNKLRVLEDKEENTLTDKNRVVVEIAFLGNDGRQHVFPGGGCVAEYNPKSQTAKPMSKKDLKDILSWFTGKK